MTKDEKRSYAIAKRLVKVLIEIEKFEDTEMLFDDLKIVTHGDLTCPRAYQNP